MVIWVQLRLTTCQVRSNRSGSVEGVRTADNAQCCCASVELRLPCRSTAPAEKSRTSTSNTVSRTSGDGDRPNRPGRPAAHHPPLRALPARPPGHVHRRRAGPAPSRHPAGGPGRPRDVQPGGSPSPRWPALRTSLTGRRRPSCRTGRWQWQPSRSRRQDRPGLRPRDARRRLAVHRQAEQQVGQLGGGGLEKCEACLGVADETQVLPQHCSAARRAGTPR